MTELKLPDGDHLWFDHNGSGEPLLLVPGLSGSAHFFDPHLNALSAQYLVVTHDHRGTGRSARTRGEYSIEQMANDVIALADHLELKSFHYVGHSTGGAIGQHLALEHPERVRSLVLSSTWSGYDSYFQSLFTLRRDVLKDMGMGAYKRIASLTMKPPKWFDSANSGSLDTTTDVADSAAGASDAHITLSRLQALLNFDVRDRLGEIDTPTLVLCAEDDAVTPAHCSRELAEKISGAKLFITTQGGHFWPDIDPDLFNREVLTFLRAISQRSV